MSEGVRSVERRCQRLVDCRPQSNSSTSQVNGDGGRPPQPARRGDDTRFEEEIRAELREIRRSLEEHGSRLRAHGSDLEAMGAGLSTTVARATFESRYLIDDRFSGADCGAIMLLTG